MVIPRQFLTLLALALVSPSAAATEDERFLHHQQEADRHYQAGDFESAYDAYRKLARKGDSFSQYRVSYMYLEGQGREQDIVESVAWAVLAAQDGQAELVKYRNAVAKLVPEKKRRKAERKVDYYMRRWGNVKAASSALSGSREELLKCTGSRVGNRCGRVEYSMPIGNYWSETGEGHKTNAVGRAALDEDYYDQLRNRIRDLDSYIRENAGKVEIGELEITEEES